MLIKIVISVFLSLALLLTACVPTLPRVVKIGLVAPFEGRQRAIGYDAIYAARLAAREINAAGGVNGWQLELVAYDDRADPEMARAAARNLLTDPDVVAVIGHYRQETTEAAGEFYAAEGLPLIAPGGWLTDATGVWRLWPSPDALAARMLTATTALTPYPLPAALPQAAAWTTAYRAVGPHVPDPGIYALPTYEAVYVLAEALKSATQSGAPTRSSVAAALPGVRRAGLLGTIAWDAEGFWRDAPLYEEVAP